MKTNTVTEQLKDQLGRIDMNKTLFLRYQKKVMDGAASKDDLLNYIHNSERLAIHARSLPDIAGVPDPDLLLRDALVFSHDISVSLLSEGWVYLTMDALLPSKGLKIPKEYILYPVTYALEQFQKDTLYHVSYSQTLIVVRHVYSDDKPLGLIRDHDNIETKTLIDTVKSHLLEDDSGMSCSLFFSSKFGPQDMTEVFVLPCCDLPLWCEFYS